MKLHKLLLLSVALLAAAGAPHAQAQRSRTKPAVPAIEADRIVAVVNHEVITLHELRSRLATVERQLRSQGTQAPTGSAMEKQLLERMIIDRIQLQFAKETSIQVDDSQLDTALRRIAESSRLSLTEFREALERDGVVWSKFREEVRDEMTIARVRDREVDSRIAVSEGEIDNYLANQTSGGGSEEVSIAHILLRISERANAEQLLRVRARAEQVLVQLRRGDDFAKVAATYSDAPDALNGGLVGSRAIDRLPGIYAEAVKRLQPGEFSEILRSPGGFHIVKLIERHGSSKAFVKPVRQTLARHILIKVNEVVPEGEAKRKIVALKERLDHGADFAELARLNSNDLSASKGGDLGWLHQGDTVPEFEKAMDALKLNEISGPVQTQYGWHLIQVLERRIESASTERQRQAARQVLRESKLDEAYQDWIRQMRDRAYVDIRLSEK